MGLHEYMERVRGTGENPELALSKYIRMRISVRNVPNTDAQVVSRCCDRGSAVFPE